MCNLYRYTMPPQKTRSMQWLIGGDWSMELEQPNDWWELDNTAQVVETEGPKQVQGRNLDWFAGSVRFPVSSMGTLAVQAPGDWDHWARQANKDS